MYGRFKFEELRVYKEAIELTSRLYILTKSWPSQYKFSLTDQLQRASLSIALNIAEGSGRTSKDFSHFLSISRGSCYECVAILTVAFKQGVIDKKDFELLYNSLEYIAKMLTLLRTRI